MRHRQGLQSLLAVCLAAVLVGSVAAMGSGSSGLPGLRIRLEPQVRLVGIHSTRLSPSAWSGDEIAQLLLTAPGRFLALGQLDSVQSAIAWLGPQGAVLRQWTVKGYLSPATHVGDTAWAPLAGRHTALLRITPDGIRRYPWPVSTPPTWAAGEMLPHSVTSGPYHRLWVTGGQVVSPMKTADPGAPSQDPNSRGPLFHPIIAELAPNRTIVSHRWILHDIIVGSIATLLVQNAHSIWLAASAGRSGIVYPGAGGRSELIHVDSATGRATVLPIPTRRLNIWDAPFAVYALTSLPGGRLGVTFRNPRVLSQMVPTLYRWAPATNQWSPWAGAASSQSQLWPDAVTIGLDGKVWFSDTPTVGSITQGIPGHTTGAFLQGLGSWRVRFQPTHLQRPAYAFLPAGCSLDL